MTERVLRLGQVYRYPRESQPHRSSIDGLPNFFACTDTPGFAKAQLERGISRLKPVRHASGRGLVPGILVRSSPWKAGTSVNPWRDSFDASRGVACYHGDNKIDPTTGAARHVDPLESLGNRHLLDAFWAHSDDRAAVRDQGGPVVLFTGVTVDGRVKGNVRFDGVGVVTSASFVRQFDDETGVSFRNLLFEFTLLDLSEEGGVLDWRWVAARRAADNTAGLAPIAWSRWVRGGQEVIDEQRLRHWRVAPLSMDSP